MVIFPFFNQVYSQYWPEDFNQEQQYGDLYVKMLSAETRGPIVTRKFVITNKNKVPVCRTVRVLKLTKVDLFDSFLGNISRKPQ